MRRGEGRVVIERELEAHIRDIAEWSAEQCSGDRWQQIDRSNSK